MYADDTTIYFNIEEITSIINLQQDNTNELENITLWLKRNKLSLNVQKTKLMVFHSINGITIERV